jgi:hypothetical protein
MYYDFRRRLRYHGLIELARGDTEERKKENDPLLLRQARQNATVSPMLGRKGNWETVVRVGGFAV